MIQFSYGLADELRTYNERRQNVPAWDTSGAAPLTERYYFNTDDLLEEKRAEGDGYKVVELITYDTETRMPYNKEIRRYDPTGATFETTMERFTYDVHGDLLYSATVYQGAIAPVSIRETFAWYDPIFHQPVKTIQTAEASEAGKMIKVDNVVDGYGRIAQSTKSMVTETTVSATLAASDLGTYLYTGQFWNWLPPAKVSTVNLSIHWRSAALWDHAKYKIYYKKYYEKDWVLYISRSRGGKFASDSGTDPYTITLPNSDYYEIKVVCTDSRVNVSAASAVSTTGHVAGETAVTTFVYHPTYRANVVSQTTGSYTINYEYDSTYNTYLDRIYAANVNNPGYGVTGETVQVQYTYDFFGRMTSLTDGLEHQTVYTYDKFDRITGETHLVDDTEKTVNYDDVNRRVTLTDEDGVAAIFEYDALGRHVKTYGLDGAVELVLVEKVYNTLGRVFQQKDAEGHTTTYYYDAAGRLRKTVFPDGTSRWADYDDKSLQTAYIDAADNRTFQQRDRLGNVLEQAVVLMPKNGLLGEYFDNQDLTNRLVRRIDTAIDFDWGSGSPDPQIDADTFSVRWTGRIEAEATELYTFYTDTDDGVRLWIDGRLVIDEWTKVNCCAVSVPLNAGQKYEITMEQFDNTGTARAKLYWSRPSQATEHGVRAEYFDDEDLANPKVIRNESVIDFNWEGGSPDPLIYPESFSARWIAEVEPEYSESYTFYVNVDRYDSVRLWVNGQLIINEWSWTLWSTEYNGQITLEAGKKYTIILEYQDHLGESRVRLSWSSASQPKQVVPNARLYVPARVIIPAGKLFLAAQSFEPEELQTVATFEYNMLGQVTKFIDGNGQIIEYEYGLFGMIEERNKKADGTQSALSNIKYEYDELGNVTKKLWMTDPSSGVYNRWMNFQYDEVGRLIRKTYSWTSSETKFRYNLAGNLIEADNIYQGTDPYTVSTDYTYTQRNFLDVMTQNIGGRVYSVDFATSDGGRIESILYPGSLTQAVYDYDVFGRVEKVRDGISGQYYLGSAALPGIYYRDTGFIERLEYGNGMIQEFTPDNRNRIDLIELYHRDTPGTKELDLDYTLDGESNVLSIGSDSFTYDNQNRLVTASIDGQTWTYNLDVMGNRTSVVENGVTKTYTTVDHNLLTAAGDATYTYDSLGNTTSKTVGTDVWTYQYDEENKLRKVLLNGVVIGDYWYNAGGMRVRTAADGVTTCYVNNGVSVLQEDNVNTGERTDYIFVGAIRIAAKKSGIVKYFHADHLGSTRVLTNEAGAWTAKYKYDAFGKTIMYMGGDDTEYRFTGKQEDMGTDLYYYGGRYYDPAIGRFITIDPVRDGLNWYEYCRNNPIKYIDPTGFMTPEEEAAAYAEETCQSLYQAAGVTVTDEEVETDNGTLIVHTVKQLIPGVNDNVMEVTILSSVIMGYTTEGGFEYLISSTLGIYIFGDTKLDGNLFAEGADTFLNGSIGRYIGNFYPGAQFDLGHHGFQNAPSGGLTWTFNGKTYNTEQYTNILYGYCGASVNLPLFAINGMSAIVAIAEYGNTKSEVADRIHMKLGYNAYRSSH